MKLNKRTIVAFILGVALLCGLGFMGGIAVQSAKSEIKNYNDAVFVQESADKYLVILPDDFYKNDGYDDPQAWLADLVNLRSSWESYVDNKKIELEEYFPTEQEEELRELEYKILNARSIKEAIEYGNQATEIVAHAELVKTNETPLDPSITSGYFQTMGIIEWGDWTYSYYSENVLPGGGLSIPGRHVDKNGFIRDIDGYICVANERGDGFICESPWGMCKVYDKGTYGNQMDVYCSW